MLQEDVLRLEVAVNHVHLRDGWKRTIKKVGCGGDVTRMIPHMKDVHRKRDDRHMDDQTEQHSRKKERTIHDTQISLYTKPCIVSTTGMNRAIYEQSYTSMRPLRGLTDFARKSVQGKRHNQAKGGAGLTCEKRTR